MEQPTTTAAPPAWRRRLPVVGLVFSVWAVLPPYVGPALNTATRVEVADHVIPAALMLVVMLVSLGFLRRPVVPATGMLVAGLTVSLAGLWMTFTHIPLLVQAARGEAPTGASIYHSAPGFAVLALGAVWAASYWQESS